MDVRLASFASELVKVAAKDKKKSRSYLGAVAAGVPFALASSTAEIPKGWADKFVEQAVARVPAAKQESNLLRGIARFAGRAGPSVLTTPVFISGIRDIQSGDKKRKKKGLAKVVGSGIALSTMKGYTEGAVENALKSGKTLKQEAKLLAASRGIVGALAALGVVTSAAKAAKPAKKGEKEKGVGKKYIAPAAVGLSGGAAKGAFDKIFTSLARKEGTLKERLAKLKTPEGIRGVAGSAAGRAAAGAVGAVALTEIIRRLMPKEKKAEANVEGLLKGTTTARDLYNNTRKWAEGKDDQEVLKLYKEVNVDGIGERTPPRRAAYYALYDELTERGHSLPAPKMRDRVSDRYMKVSPVEATGLVAAAVLAPDIGMGLTLSIPPSERDKMLNEALDKNFIQGKLQRVTIPAHGMPMVNITQKRIHLRKNERELPGIIAHELGHSTAGPGRQALLTKDMHFLRLMGSVFSVVVPLATVMTASDGSFTTPEELKNKATLVQNAGLASGAMQLPVVTEEAIAHFKAIGFLERSGASSFEAITKVLTQGGPGFLTYAAPIALPFLAAAYLKSKAKKEAERE